MASMPRLLATLGVKVLRSVPLRQAANKVSSCDGARLPRRRRMEGGVLQPGPRLD